MTKEGKIFEHSIEQSCSKQNIFYFRVRDVNLPPDVRMRVKLPPNKYDCLMFHKEHLFTIEIKSTKSRSISFSESIIKKHQIENLREASSKYDGLIAGFIFNFREYDNFTCFIHIQDFVEIKYLSENQIIEHGFQSKLNKSSIGLDICKEVGIEIKNYKKRTKYHYYISQFLDQLIQKYNTNIHIQR